jgi:hypothetical protein
MAPAAVDSQPIHEDVSTTRARRARDVSGTSWLADPAHGRNLPQGILRERDGGESLWSVILLYTVFLTVIAAIIVGAFAPPESLEWSVPTNAWQKFR